MITVTRGRPAHAAAPLDLFPEYRPRLVHTSEGQVWHRLINRWGFARVARHAPRIARALRTHPRRARG